MLTVNQKQFIIILSDGVSKFDEEWRKGYGRGYDRQTI